MSWRGWFLELYVRREWILLGQQQQPQQPGFVRASDDVLLVPWTWVNPPTWGRGFPSFVFSDNLTPRICRLAGDSMFALFSVGGSVGAGAEADL